MTTETEFAPAKINLTLHVTGQRTNGYHLLDSLVVFAGVGDRVTVSPGQGFAVTGPMAADLPASGDNLCLRAAAAMGGGVAVTLEKHLPVASGIGGGSADAAATLRAMARLGRPLPPAPEVLKLGADVPVCLRGHPLRMQGVGEVLTPVTLPAAWLVLVNPRQAVATRDVFAGLARRDHAPMPRVLPRLRLAADLAAFLAMQRNDLAAAAETILPGIARVRDALSAQAGCLFARMSGSGATCFGLFDTALGAAAAARSLAAAHPEWWVADAPVL